jgi:uncharacterized protein YqeY
MTLKQQIEQDLKTALLSGDKTQATTLRGLKSAILYAEVAQGKRDPGLDDQGVIEVLTKESKMRQESADLYIQGGDQTRAQAELTEKSLIHKYLPEQLSESAISTIIEQSITELGTVGPQDMGKVIGIVKGKTKGAADGATIARLVKEKISA